MYEIANENEYLMLKNREVIYNKWAEQYKQKNGWTVIPVDAIPPVKFDNDDRSAMEVWEWKHNPPEKYFLYITETKNNPVGFPYEKPLWIATTWTGQKLGNVRYGAEFHCWGFGRRSTRQSITVYGNNGVRYYGTYYKSSGNYARIKRMKNQ